MWEAEVGFCAPWPYGWGLLGQQSFFRFFTVTFRAVDFALEVTPSRLSSLHPQGEAEQLCPMTSTVSKFEPCVSKV